jgi:hypothetical protein
MNEACHPRRASLSGAALGNEAKERAAALSPPSGASEGDPGSRSENGPVNVAFDVGQVARDAA